MGQKRKQSSRLQPFFKNSRRHGKVSKAPPAKQGKKHAPTAATGGGHWWGDPWGGLNAPNLPATAIPFFKISLGGAGGLSWQERLPAQPPAPRKARKKKHAPTAAAGGGHWRGDPWGGLNAPNLPATAIPFFKISWEGAGGPSWQEGPPAHPASHPAHPHASPSRAYYKKERTGETARSFCFMRLGGTGTYSRSAIS